MKTIKQLQKQVDKLLLEIETIKNKGNWLKIPELNIEVEIDIHNKDESWNNLNLDEKENQLLTVEQCIFLVNSKYAKKLKMDGSSSNDNFFIKQPFKLNKQNNYIARFGAIGDGAGLGCRGDPSSRNSNLGVRFVRELKK